MGPREAGETRIVLLLGMAASGSLFAALAGTGLALRSGAGAAWRHPDGFLLLLVAGVQLVVLVIASFMAETALRCLRRGDGIGVRATLLNACAKGAACVLLIGLSWVLLADKGFTPAHSTFSALYFLASALLAVHVAAATALTLPLAVRRARPDAAAVRNSVWAWRFNAIVAGAMGALFHL